MIVALTLVLFLLVSAVAIGHQLEKAPEGFQNQTGFHFVRRDSVPGSAINVRPGAAGILVRHDEGAAVGSLS
jgi:hypothetical protein